jgi:hypothetical protein
MQAVEILLSILINTTEYKCVRWEWWWDGQYRDRIVRCLEWKKVEKK